MDYKQRIQSVLNYIESHVQEDIPCESLVALAGFSTLRRTPASPSCHMYAVAN
ncbi:hypothetical protein M4D81_34230 [Paenibacillus sp. p3-SID867]|uniref:hypothetical protein n=1 Tax=Paenibacillus sp. p3-SID867 TaxID=2916363 RepID=UPI0021A8E084|nr:hypothetical protein [Paenibacillus sp. p3-SID867]MCT1404069.1 hypothetical protein [Paenibacillus sp. p3-SID867]